MEQLLVLWALNLALLLAVLVLGWDVFGARRHRLRSQRRGVLAAAVNSLPRASLVEDLLAAWTLVIESGRPGWTKVSVGMAQRVVALDLADDEVLRLVRHDFNDAVNELNKLCALIDEGLVRPKDIVRTYPRDHERLLTALHLLEPFIWYESILRGRGRWGFRVTELCRITKLLRPVSKRRVLQEKYHLEICGLTIMALPEIHPIARLSRLALLSLRSPTINVRSKLNQAKYRDSLARELSELGVAIHRPAGRKDSVEW